jgi:hypothetical protein
MALRMAATTSQNSESTTATDVFARRSRFTTEEPSSTADPPIVIVLRSFVYAAKP